MVLVKRVAADKIVYSQIESAGHTLVGSTTLSNFCFTTTRGKESRLPIQLLALFCPQLQLANGCARFLYLGCARIRISLASRSVQKCPYKEASYKPLVRCRNACGLRDALVTSVIEALGLRPRVLSAGSHSCDT